MRDEIREETMIMLNLLDLSCMDWINYNLKNHSDRMRFYFVVDILKHEVAILMTENDFKHFVIYLYDDSATAKYDKMDSYIDITQEEAVEMIK